MGRAGGGSRMRGREEAEGMGGCEGIDVKVDSGFWGISSYIVPLEDREKKVM
jgi:hypothetical protein